MDAAIEGLERYFAAREDIAFALLFGSRASGRARPDSDWDVGVYFRIEGRGLDLEDADRRFPEETGIWNDAENLVGASVDLVVLNRAPATLASAALAEGILLACPDRRAFDRFHLAADLLAEDERVFARDFAAIKARSSSLSLFDRDRVLRLIDFIQSELADAGSFRDMSLDAYLREPSRRRNLERWVENLLRLSTLPGFIQADCEALASFSRLRNLLAHEYLDLRYPLIEGFIQTGPDLYRRLADTARLMLEAPQEKSDG